MKLGDNGGLVVFTSGGDSSSETFTWEEYLAAQASLEAESITGLKKVDLVVQDALTDGIDIPNYGQRAITAMYEDVFVPVEEYATEEDIESISRRDKASVDLSMYSNEQLIDKLLERFKNKKPPSPYHRKITKRALLNGLFMDSYDIDAMWPLPGNLSPLQHARKKSLAPGSRGEGHKSIKKDLAEIAWSAKEAIQTYIDME